MEPDDERLLWTLLRRFEALALERYAAHAPALATPEKRALLARLTPSPAGEAALRASPLAAPVARLLEAAAGGGRGRVLVGQAWVLEVLGRALYGLLVASQRSSAETRSLAAAGQAASESVLLALPRALEEHCGGAPTFDLFASESQPVLERLEPLGEGLDAAFAATLGLGFAEVIGAFSADLVTCCQSLGLSRREVLGHLAAALMGLT